MLVLRRLVVACVLVLVFSPVAWAYPDSQQAPRYFPSDCIGAFDRRFVYDFVGTFDEWGALVEGAACEVYAKTGAHFALATVQNTEGEPLESYALHLFESWGIGEGERNDGILLLYVKDYNLDNKPSALRIEVGYGLEGVVNSLVAIDAIDIMRQAKADYLGAGYSEREAVEFALASGAHVLLNTLNDQYVDGAFPAPRSSWQDVPLSVWIIAVAIILVIVLILASAAKSPRKGWGYYPGSPQWSSGMGGYFAGQILGGMLGGGRGGGGGGFGGGRSGGGGGSGGF